MGAGSGDRDSAAVHRVFLSLGSNVGDRESHLRHALTGLARRAGRVVAVSRVYETDPVGFLDQPRFLNLAASLDTKLEPERLLRVVHALEAERGRRRTFRNGPRTLDIDILLYDDRRLELAGLTVPHPRMTERAFVLVPLLELDPDVAEPGSGRRYREYVEGPVAGMVPVLDGNRLLEDG